MKTLYLFGGTRKDQIEKVKSGLQPDDHFHGMLRINKYDVDADILELEDTYPIWLAHLIRKYLNVYFVHIPVFFKIFSNDIVFASTAYGTQLVHALLHIKRPKWVINDFGLVGRIGEAKSIKQKIFRWMVGRANGIITLGKKEAEDLTALYPHLNGKIEFLPFGVDTEFFKPISIAEENQIMSTGFDPGRDYKLLFKAIEDVDVNLFISKSRNVDLMTALPSRVQTFYLSWRKLVMAYAKSKIVVIPLNITGGKNDAMGTSSLVQAMAMGKAIIATRTPTTESYITNGINGILVEMGDVGGLKSAIVDLLDNVEKRMILGQNARIFAETSCNADIIACKLAGFFKKIGSN